MKNKGLIHIYTGDGKGKTTAAVGLAIRALGHGFRVCYAHFHKRPELYGYNEIQSLEKLGATIFGFTGGHPFCNKTLTREQLQREVREGLQFLSGYLTENEPDLLIMDEILISVRDGYLAEEELLDFISHKPEHTELVMTGRGATDKLIARADYVSHVSKVKHPYDQDIPSREGIEF